ncbi:MAG TPA: DNA polymerase III subunit chi [Burkholderiales bacterium]|nr:DNA polymerase III subunit chi [Burkholderiales bacterium]
MTEVLFYTHVGDRLQTACTLAQKALARQMRVMVFTEDAAATESFSRLLWSVPSTGFVPHCRGSDRLAGVTPVIVDHREEPLAHDQVLINLRAGTPAFFSRFRRLVEIVGLEEADRNAARERFRFYRDRGYEIKTHQLGARPES